MLDQETRFPDFHDSAAYGAFHEVHFSTRVIPAALAASGGDWCEVFHVAPNVVGLSIGDVCGHGAAAFEPMKLVRQAVRDAASAGLRPDAVLRAANDFVLALQGDLMATALFALFDVTSGEFTFANAGHPPPLVVDAARPTFLGYDRSDSALGIEPVLLPAIHRETLPPNALLVLYTDGVTERDRDVFRGERELCAAAKFVRNFNAHSPAAMIEKLLDLSGSNTDDAALLTVTFSQTQRHQFGSEQRNRPRTLSTWRRGFSNRS